MAEDHHLGKVYIFVVRSGKEKEWVSLTKYLYNEQAYNLYMHDNDYKNIRGYANKCELDMIRLGNQEIDNLSLLFKHTTKKILIGGDMESYIAKRSINQWLPEISILPKDKKVRLDKL